MPKLRVKRCRVRNLLKRPANGDDVMAFQAVPDTVEIVIEYLVDESVSVNVFGAELAGGYTLTDLENLADAVDAVVVADWLPAQVEDAVYVSTTVRGLAAENDLEAVNTDGAGGGGLIEIGSPGNVTFAVKKVSGKTGRSARGRTYWIGMQRSGLTANLNRMDASAAAAIVGAVDALRAGIVTEGWAPVIISRFSGGVKRAQGVTFTWIDSVSVDLNVDSQRRRLL